MGTKGHIKYATIANEYSTCICDIWFKCSWLHCDQCMWNVWLRSDDPNFKIGL